MKRLIFSLLYEDGYFVLSRNFNRQKVGDINWLLKNYKPSQVTVIHLSQPIFGILIGFVVLGENIGPLVLVGALLVILGSGLVRKNSN